MIRRFSLEGDPLRFGMNKRILFFGICLFCSLWPNFYFAWAGEMNQPNCSAIVTGSTTATESSQVLLGLSLQEHRARSARAVLEAKATLSQLGVRFTEVSNNGFSWLEVASEGDAPANQFVRDLQAANEGGPKVLVFPYFFTIAPGGAAAYISTAAGEEGFSPSPLGQMHQDQGIFRREFEKFGDEVGIPADSLILDHARINLWGLRSMVVFHELSHRVLAQLRKQGLRGSLADAEGFALVSDVTGKNGFYFSGVLLEELLVELLELEELVRSLGAIQEFPGLLSDSEAQSLSRFASLNGPREILTAIEVRLGSIVKLTQPLWKIKWQFLMTARSRSLTPEIFRFKGVDWSRFLVEIEDENLQGSTAVAFVVPLLPLTETDLQHEQSHAPLHRTLAVVTELENIGIFIGIFSSQSLSFLIALDELKKKSISLSLKHHEGFRNIISELGRLLDREELKRLIPSPLPRPTTRR